MAMARNFFKNVPEVEAEVATDSLVPPNSDLKALSQVNALEMIQLPSGEEIPTSNLRITT